VAHLDYHVLWLYKSQRKRRNRGRRNPAKSKGKNTGNRNIAGELTKKDPKQRRILSTEDERRGTGQRGLGRP
jgi:hypothetical protein